MNDELSDQVNRAASMTDEVVARLPLSGAETALMEEIMSTPVLVEPTAEPPRRQHRRRSWVVPVAAAAALALLAGGLWLSRDGHDPAVPQSQGSVGGVSGYAAEVVRVAEANARVLVDEPGWKVTLVDEFTAAEGEMMFGNGKLGLELNWYPREQYQGFLDDRLGGGLGDPVRVEVLDKQGSMFRYNDTDFETILPPEGSNFLMIRGGVGDERAYRGILAALISVDVQTWLDALSESAVQPQDHDAVVDEMLKGIPLPDGFDRDGIKLGDGVRHRYHVGAAVVGEITCGWYEQWREGKRSGDDDAVADAVEAMRGSRSWPVLREMAKEGAYPELIWDVADGMADGRVRAGQIQKVYPTCEELALK